MWSNVVLGICSDREVETQGGEAWQTRRLTRSNEKRTSPAALQNLRSQLSFLLRSRTTAKRRSFKEQRLQGSV